MRTTLSLDADVAAHLDQLRAERGIGLEKLVNEALRYGLRELGRRPKATGRYRTRGVDLGRCCLAELDDVAAALAATEGGCFR
jgi:hypothetical protein